MQSRVERAQELFSSGYNCAQSVFAAYADLFGMDRETALKLSCPMGAGIGRMREVCGTVCAMSMENGTLLCRELLGISGMEESAAPSERTPEYYASRPCLKIVGCAARIVEKHLFSEKELYKPAEVD